MHQRVGGMDSNYWEELMSGWLIGYQERMYREQRTILSGLTMCRQKQGMRKRADENFSYAYPSYIASFEDKDH